MGVLVLPYPVSSSITCIVCSPRILASGLMSGSALGSVTPNVAASAGSLDVSPSSLD